METHIKAKVFVMGSFKFAYCELRNLDGEHEDDKFLATKLANTMVNAYYMQILKEGIEEARSKGL